MLEMIPVYRNFKNIFLFQNCAKVRAYQKAKNHWKTRKNDIFLSQKKMTFWKCPTFLTDTKYVQNIGKKKSKRVSRCGDGYYYGIMTSLPAF